MSQARIKSGTSVPKTELDRLDKLISGYLTTLLERTDDVKLADFTKLVDLRHRLSPADDPTSQAWHDPNAARAQKLPYSSLPSGGEEPSS